MMVRVLTSDVVVSCFALLSLQGLIPVVSLVHLLRNLGEPLTRSDVDNLLQEVRLQTGLLLARWI
jgi:hypothetical protein